MEDNKNLILAIALSLTVLLGYQYFFVPKQENNPIEQVQKNENTINENKNENKIEKKIEKKVAPEVIQKKKIEESARLYIKNEKINGSIRLRGGQIDDLVLTNYKESVKENSTSITLLSKLSSENPYYIDLGWVSPDPDVRVPDSETSWEASSSEISENNQSVLTWSNSEGLIFERIISIDKSFLITIKQKVHNNTDKAIQLHPYANICRTSVPNSSTWTFHEGPVGFLGEKLQEKSFDKMKEENSYKSTGGWAGIADKYWLVAFIPEQKINNTVKFRCMSDVKFGQYQVESLSDYVEIKPKGSAESTYHLFLGAKEIEILDAYEKKLGVTHFDLAIDFGYFYFLTKPIYYVLVYMKNFIGNLGVCIILLTLLIKLFLFPLANKSYRAMSRMKKLQPKIQELQKRYENDKARLSQEMMALYKREKVNPLGGCLPQLVQFPVLFALYKVFLISIEMRHAPFFGWVKDLSSADPAWIVNFFGFIPWNPPELLQVGVWPLLMGATMLIQQKMSPPPADPAQAKVMLIMPVMFTFMLAQLPSGLVIYWTFSNLLSILQQWIITKLEERREINK